MNLNCRLSRGERDTLCSPGCPGRRGEEQKQCLSTGLVRVRCVDTARVMSAGSWSVTERNCPISWPLIAIIAYRVYLMSSSTDANRSLTRQKLARSSPQGFLVISLLSDDFYFCVLRTKATQLTRNHPCQRGGGVAALSCRGDVRRVAR